MPRSKEEMREMAAKGRAAKDAKQEEAGKSAKAKSKPQTALQKKHAAAKKAMGPIDRWKTYEQDLFCQLTGMGRLSWRRALQSGLKVAHHGTRIYIAGESWYEWVRMIAERQAAQLQAETEQPPSLADSESCP